MLSKKKKLSKKWTERHCEGDISNQSVNNQTTWIASLRSQ